LPPCNEYEYITYVYYTHTYEHNQGAYITCMLHMPPGGYQKSFNLHSFEHVGSKACDKLVLLTFYLSFFLISK